MVKTLNFVSDGELVELGEITGNSMVEVFENATQSLIENEHLEEEDLETSEWEEGEELGTYYLTAYDYRGDKKTFELE